MMSISRNEISASIDGEMSPSETDRIRRLLTENGEASREAEQFQTVSAMLAADRDAATRDEIDESASRVRDRLRHSVRGLVIRRSWWDRDVRVPVPVAVAASAAFVLMTVMAVVTTGYESTPTVGSLADGENTMNIQVNVEGDQTDALLQWLNQQESFNSVTSQLPDQAELRMHGAPVFLRRDEEGGELRPIAPTHSNHRFPDEEIVPLTEGE
jgi:negative regulator of sigma E activity